MPEEIETAFCEECDDEFPFKERKVKKIYKIRGIEVEVEIYRGVCVNCGHEVYPAKYDRINFLIAHDEYKKKTGLLTSKEIIAIRKKRKMSQTDLANFIKCGEKNIARYERGCVQDPVFDYLIRLVDDDEAYAEMNRLNKTIDYHKFQPNKKQLREQKVDI